MPTTMVELTPAAAQAYEVSAPQDQRDMGKMMSNIVINFRSIERNHVPNNALYEQDFYTWTQTTADLIRAGQWDAIDRDTLAEEIESLGKSEQRELSNRLATILEHLLKLAIAASHFPHDLNRAERGWRVTVKTQRLRVAHLLRDNHNLHTTVPHALTDAYEIARLEAAAAFDIEEVIIPETCPWKPEQVRNMDYWPETIS